MSDATAAAAPAPAEGRRPPRRPAGKEGRPAAAADAANGEGADKTRRPPRQPRRDEELPPRLDEHGNLVKITKPNQEQFNERKEKYAADIQALRDRLVRGSRSLRMPTGRPGTRARVSGSLLTRHVLQTELSSQFTRRADGNKGLGAQIARARESLKSLKYATAARCNPWRRPPPSLPRTHTRMQDRA